MTDELPDHEKARKKDEMKVQEESEKVSGRKSTINILNGDEECSVLSNKNINADEINSTQVKIVKQTTSKSLRRNQKYDSITTVQDNKSIFTETRTDCSFIKDNSPLGNKNGKQFIHKQTVDYKATDDGMLNENEILNLPDPFDFGAEMEWLNMKDNIIGVEQLPSVICDNKGLPSRVGMHSNQSILNHTSASDADLLNTLHS